MERQLLQWMFTMVTASIKVIAQVDIMDRGFFLQEKEASRPPSLKNASLDELEVPLGQNPHAWTRKTHGMDNGAHLVWRQPLWVSFLFEEPNIYQYRFGLLWENSSWPLSHSSLWASHGLVNILHNFACLYSAASLKQHTVHIFHDECYWKTQLQLHSDAANFTLPTYQCHSLSNSLLKLLIINYLTCKKKKAFQFYWRHGRFSFPASASCIDCSSVRYEVRWPSGLRANPSMAMSLHGCPRLANMGSQVVTGVWRRDTCLAMCWFSDPFTGSCGQHLWDSQNMPSHLMKNYNHALPGLQSLTCIRTPQGLLSLSLMS